MWLNFVSIPSSLSWWKGSFPARVPEFVGAWSLVFRLQLCLYRETLWGRLSYWNEKSLKYRNLMSHVKTWSKCFMLREGNEWKWVGLSYSSVLDALLGRTCGCTEKGRACLTGGTVHFAMVKVFQSRHEGASSPFSSSIRAPALLWLVLLLLLPTWALLRAGF